MSGTIIENLSGKKLTVLVTILLLAQLACFLVGIISPSPASSQAILTTVCVDKNLKDIDKVDRWFTRQCPTKIELNQEHSTVGLKAENLVFVAEMPLYQQDFSRWQQNLAGILNFDMIYRPEQHKEDPRIKLTLDARLAYSDKLSKGGKSPWKYYSSAVTTRYMDCFLNEAQIKRDDYLYNCSMVPLFELGSLYHDYYLLNLRLPVDLDKNINTQLSRIHDIYLHIIHMNGGFTKVWVSLKTIFFPIVIGIMVWFWNRIHILTREAVLLEYMLMTLGGTLALLDFPLEYFTLYFDMPFMLFLSDIIQGVFYAVLLLFWLVFTGEHMLIQDGADKNGLRKYWKHISSIVISCICLFMFDLFERGTHLVNPFHSIWSTPLGTNMALTFVICAGLSASCYMIFLCYMVWRVLKNIKVKRSVLPNMTQARRLHYEGLIYRFIFLMVATLVCAIVTIISFTYSQYEQNENKWDDNMGIEITSIVQTGVYGMWNVYICALLMLYAPSHKKWPSDSADGVEFHKLSDDTTGFNEISALTSFVAKSNIE